MRRSLFLAGLLVLVLAAPAAAGTHANTDALSIPDDNSNTPAERDIEVFGEPGLVQDVNVAFTSLDHANPDDLDIALRSPRGTVVTLISDSCGQQDVVDGDWTFDDEADPLSFTDDGPCPGGTLSGRPAATEDDTWMVDPDGSQLSLFDGENPNGAWTLLVADDANGSIGDLAAVAVTLDVGSSEIQVPGGENSVGPASPYPATTTVSSDGIVTDVDVLLRGMTHSYPGDLEILLEGPRGQKVRLMSDACFGAVAEVIDLDWDIDDAAPASFPDDDECDGPTYRPADYEEPVGTDAFPGPAPGGPYGSSLSDFNLTDPNGEWKLWVVDDEDLDAGFIIGGYDVQVQTRPRAAVDLGPDTTTAEGLVASLLVTRGGAAPMVAGTIRVRTVDGSAQAGLDFTPVDQVLSFAAGETSKTVEVPIVSDATVEPGQAFTVNLADAGGDAAVGARSATTVTIAPDPTLTPPPTPPPPPTTLSAFNRANATRLPSNRRCRRRRSRLRPRAVAPPGVTLARTELFVNGRRVANRAGARADDPIVVRVRRRRTRLRMVVTAGDGRSVTARRTYRRCKPRRRRG